MADDQTTFQQVKDCVAEFEAARRWRPFHSPKNLAMGIAIETGELLEHFQWLTTDESNQVRHDPEQMARIRHEMADVLCYLVNLALVLEVDLSEAFFQKMRLNDQKYPADQYRGRYKL
ncbi:MAG: nucleotide pyrophosphohydrolase [Sedimentisphaerales bacterium]|nr:nucleotide pyrophosphohydrolase [Sedimentisphaerales bacterium]